MHTLLYIAVIALQLAHAVSGIATTVGVSITYTFVAGSCGSPTGVSGVYTGQSLSMFTIQDPIFGSPTTAPNGQTMQIACQGPVTTTSGSFILYYPAAGQYPTIVVDPIDNGSYCQQITGYNFGLKVSCQLNQNVYYTPTQPAPDGVNASVVIVNPSTDISRPPFCGVGSGTTINTVSGDHTSVCNNINLTAWNSVPSASLLQVNGDSFYVLCYPPLPGYLNGNAVINYYRGSGCSSSNYVGYYSVSDPTGSECTQVNDVVGFYVTCSNVLGPTQTIPSTATPTTSRPTTTPASTATPTTSPASTTAPTTSQPTTPPVSTATPTTSLASTTTQTTSPPTTSPVSTATPTTSLASTTTPTTIPPTTSFVSTATPTTTSSPTTTQTTTAAPTTDIASTQPPTTGTNQTTINTNTGKYVLGLTLPAIVAIPIMALIALIGVLAWCTGKCKPKKKK